MGDTQGRGLLALSGAEGSPAGLICGKAPFDTLRAGKALPYPTNPAAAGEDGKAPS